MCVSNKFERYGWLKAFLCHLDGLVTLRDNSYAKYAFCMLMFTEIVKCKCMYILGNILLFISYVVLLKNSIKNIHEIVIQKD